MKDTLGAFHSDEKDPLFKGGRNEAAESREGARCARECEVNPCVFHHDQPTFLYGFKEPLLGFQKGASCILNYRFIASLYSGNMILSSSGFLMIFGNAPEKPRW